MKTSLLNFLFLSLVSISFAANANKTAKAESTMDIQVLTSMADAKFADFSKANGASAKLVQMAYGDGGVNTSTAYVIIQGGIDAKGYNIANMISGIN